MGECGCGEFVPFAKFPAPDGWYAVDVYPGCGECRLGPAVVIQHLTPEAAAHWDIPELPDLPTQNYDNVGVRETFIPILDPDKLRAAIIEQLDVGQYDVEGIIEDGTRADVLRHAVGATVREWQDRVLPSGERET